MLSVPQRPQLIEARERPPVRAAASPGPLQSLALGVVAASDPRAPRAAAPAARRIAAADGSDATAARAAAARKPAAAQLGVGGGDDRPQPVDLKAPRRVPRATPRPPPGTPPAPPRMPLAPPARPPRASSTRKCGSIPAATGWLAKSRLQKPWIVITQAPPMPARQRRAGSEPASARRASSARIRWRSSAAALSVKVKARIASGETPSIADQPAVALDHHPGLAGAGARLDQHVAPAEKDRRRLLGSRSALAHRSSTWLSSSLSGARSRRQIGAKSQYSGQTSWPRSPRRGPGSRRISPARIRATIAAARRRASASVCSKPRRGRPDPSHRGGRRRVRRRPRPRRRPAGAAPRLPRRGGRGRRPGALPSARRPRSGRAEAAALPAPRTSRGG